MTDDISAGQNEDPNAEPAERDDWRGAQDDPWQPDEQAPPPVIGE